jgi:hypothetical protein
MDKLNKTNTISAILAINPKAQVGIYGDDYDSIDWNAGTAVISKADIDAKKIELEAEYDAQEYARNRKAEYPDWGTQLEKIADDGIDAWKTDMLEPVKAKFPKP